MIRMHHIIYAVLSIISAGVLGLLIFTTHPDNSSEPRVFLDRAGGSEQQIVHLYFADASNSFLKAEQRNIAGDTNPSQVGRQIIEALINGPQTDLVRTLPGNTELSAFYITPDKTAFVDFTTSVTENHPGGCQNELLTLYSIVNSLVLNTSDIKQVKILVGGDEAITLAGHLDIRLPFNANMLLIR